MTGAGSADLAFGKEQSFKGSLADEDGDGSDDYWAFGRNVTVSELNLQRALQRHTEPGSVEAVESVAQNLEGTFTAEAVVNDAVHGDVHDIVFNDGGTGFTSGRCNSARVYAGINYLDGTAERELIGAIPLSYQVTYQQGGMVRYTLTMAYADEKTNSTITPSSITQPAGGDDVAFHGADLTVDAATVSKLQSATLSIDNIARMQRGADPVAVDAVIANPQTTLDFSAILNTTDHLELAYGSAGATTTEDRLSSVSGSLTFSAGGATAADYSLPQIKPDTYGWSDLVSDDADTTEEVSAHVNGGIGVSA